MVAHVTLEGILERALKAERVLRQVEGSRGTQFKLYKLLSWVANRLELLGDSSGSDAVVDLRRQAENLRTALGEDIEPLEFQYNEHRPLPPAAPPKPKEITITTNSTVEDLQMVHELLSAVTGAKGTSQLAASGTVRMRGPLDHDRETRDTRSFLFRVEAHQWKKLEPLLTEAEYPIYFRVDAWKDTEAEVVSLEEERPR